MPRSGDVISNPLTTDRFVFRQTAGETEGSLLQFDNYQDAGGIGPVDHMHPEQEERFAVVSGTMGVCIAGREHILRAGERIAVPRATVHRWWNAGDGELHQITEFRPALHTEEFFTNWYGLIRDGKVNPKSGLPNPLHLAVFMRAYRREIVVAHPPRLVQEILFGLLAPLGRLLGYRAHYPRYMEHGVGRDDTDDAVVPALSGIAHGVSRSQRAEEPPL